ncbi:MAG: hypothetical protein LQ338_006806 [Usnochroma carphineum]|nr:MAG: hypothetical protein LQ338_006806 [Usnochroma carphineum]
MDSLCHRPTQRRGEYLSSRWLRDHDGHCGLKRHANSGPPLKLGDEFGGLSLYYDYRRTRIDQFKLDTMGLVAVGAMKEEALLEYDAPLLNFDYLDIEHLDIPVRVIMDASPGAPSEKARRSTVMWALKALSIRLMQNQLFIYLPFVVWYNTQALYRGRLADRWQPINPIQTRNSTSLSFGAVSSDFSLAVISGNTSTDMILESRSPLQDDPYYELKFNYVGQSLSKIPIFESLLQLLLQLGKSDASSIQRRISMARRPYQAFLYMAEAEPRAAHRPFQQFQAVAIAEAIARYVVLQGHYWELTFEFRADSQLVARGCLTKPVQDRTWCAGLFPPGDTS